MSPAEYVYAIVAGLSLVGGFVLEWRRGGDFGARLAALEVENLADRVANIEQARERMQRNW
jgi:hypothetical protein